MILKYYEPVVRSRLCTLNYWNDKILGWLEDGNPPWRLLVPLLQPHLAHDSFQHLGVRVGPGGDVVVIVVVA